MADVFLSYKREDAARVRKLVAALRGMELDVWWDEDIPGGAQWEATIEKALSNAKAVVVCWSPASVASENVRSEARIAREDGRLIQAFLKPCTPPLFFGERQGADLSKWRGNAEDARIARLAENVRRVAAGEKVEGYERPKARRQRFEYRLHAALAVLVLLAGSLGGWWLMSPAKAAGPQTLAVLPFRALNPADTNLVDAIWDDTRGAISRNPNLRVLGRAAVKVLAKQDLSPADYRKKVGADYLLDGSIEHVGNQVQMKLSLTRTKDSAEVWSDQIGGKLDDVFAFQQRIAREVEGRIRGRVAPGGGAKAQNIVTTGEVYAIYADAREGLRKRDGQGAKRAIPLLKKALSIDPNYAPAWADLGIATGLLRNGPIDQVIAEAVSYEKRALMLAPNLAKAHAALAMVQGSPPELEPEARRAIALDPGDAEAWTWLGNLYNNQSKSREALNYYNRALEIDPSFWPAIHNKLNSLRQLNDRRGEENELRRIEATGDRASALKVQAVIADFDDSPGDSVRLLLQVRSEFPEDASWVDLRIGPALIALGFIDEGVKVKGFPPYVARDYRGIPDSPQLIQADYKRPLDFWLDDDVPATFARLLPKHGRLAEYVGYYRAAFKNPDDFRAAFPNRPGVYLMLAPNVAVNLRAGRQDAQAAQLLGDADMLLASKMREAPKDDPGLHVYLAQLRAAEARNDDVVPALNVAVNGGWLPDRMFYAVDIADEPCFANLINRPDFQAIRHRILARIEEERLKVPLDLLRRAYPPPMNVAA